MRDATRATTRATTGAQPKQSKQKTTFWGKINLRSVASALTSPVAYVKKQLGIIPTEANDNKIRTITSIDATNATSALIDTTNATSALYNSPRYKTAMISSDGELNAILGNEINDNKKAQISYISDINDLSEDNLLKKNTVVTNTADNTKSLTEAPGLLFTESEDPVVLVLDFRYIDINTIVELNPLFDTPPTMNGKPLTSNVKIISVVNNTLSYENGPGEDFWRRVFQPKTFINTQQEKYLEQTEVFQNIETKTITAVENIPTEDTEPLVIRLADENWRNKLFGHLYLDEQGGIYFHQGELATIKKNQKVYFQDAPWNDKNFSLAINKMIENNGYSANGEPIQFESGIKFHHYQTTENDLKNLQNKFKWDLPENQPKLSAPKKIKILNENLFFYCTQKAAIKNGKLINHEVFKDWITDDTAVIKVTTKLSVSQWLTLLTRLEKIGRTDICIIQDKPETQPKGWRHENKFDQTNNIINENIKIVLNNMGLIPDVLAKNQKATTDTVDIQVTPNTNIGQLTANIKSISLETLQFDIEKAEFSKALESGQNINFYGLEYNSKLMQDLESLLGNPPYLIINGFYQEFPQAKINFHLPNSIKPITQLWGVAITNAQEQHRDDFKIIKKRLHKKYAEHIDKKLSNQMFDEVVKLIKNINDVQKTAQSPKAELIIDAPLFDKIWKQAIAEQQLDGIKKIDKNCWMKAINSILIKRYRAEPETYRYIKFLVNDQFSTTKPTIDLIGLKNWVRTQKKITPKLIQDNFWLLSQYIPYNNLSLKPTNLQKSLNIFTLKNLVTGLKALVSAAVSLLKYTIFLPYYITKNIYKLIKHCFILLSRFIPWVETRVYLPAIKADEKQQVNLKDLVMAGSEALDFVNATIVSCIEDEQQQEKLQKKLNITNEQILKHQVKTNKQVNNCYQIEKILRDICYSLDYHSLDKQTQNKIESHGYQKLCHDLALNITQKVLELESTEDANKATTKTRIIAEINKSLSEILPGDTNTKNRAEIASNLLLCTKQIKLQNFWEYWSARRKLRCADKVKTNTFTMIKGDAGAGKSYMAKQVARLLNPDEDPITVNVKANMTAADLYGQFKLDPAKTEKDLIFVKGELRKWAERTGDNYQTLILDEFTLTDNLWDSLRTIKDHPPYINLDGEKIFITDKHRIIMTSNPDYFPGRKANSALTLLMAEMFYLPLSEDFQKEQIIEPEISSFIDKIKFSTDINIKNNAVNQITTCVHDLYKQYAKLIPNYEFTPRDLTDCCSRMEAYFNDYIMNNNKGELTIGMIYAVARKAMQQSVANGISNQYVGQLEAIDIWHQARFVGDDKIIAENATKFETFYNKLEIYLRQHAKKQYNNFDLNNNTTKKLCKTIWRELQRVTLERQTGIIHKGRHATLIESPPGLGKDTTIAIMNEFWQHEHDKDLSYEAVTANVKAIDSIMGKVKTKHTQGGVLSVAELNAYDTQSIEGYLNDLLTDPPKAPGFAFFVTANSAQTTRGRSEFSLALQSRFAKNIIGEHTFEDLQHIARTRVKNKSHADLITKAHWKVRSHMKKSRRNALPSLADIAKIADKIHDLESKKKSKTSSIPEQELSNIINDNYSKYLQLLGWDDKKINDFFANITQEDDSTIATNYINDLTTWINQQTNKGFNAIVVSEGIITHYNTTSGILTLSLKDQAKTDAEKQKIILDTITNTLSGKSKKLTTASTEAEAEAKTETEAKTEAKTETKEDVSSGNIDDYTANEVIDTRADVSSDDPVDKDIEKLVNRKDGIDKYNIDKGSFVIRTGSNFTMKRLDIESLASNYFKPKMEAISNLFLKHWVKKCNILSELSSYSFSDFFPASKQRVNLAKKALAELKGNQFLQQQLKTICTRENKSENDFDNFLKNLINSTETFIFQNNNEVYLDILAELNSSACNILCCAVLNFRESLKNVNLFTTVISKGYISYNTAIKLIENNNTLINRFMSSKGILTKCCETLKKGKNIKNISKIIKYLIKREGDCFNDATLHSLIEISEMDQLEDLANAAKTELNGRYERMLNTPMNFSATIQTVAKDTITSEYISPEAKEALMSINANNFDKIITTNTESTVKYSWNPTATLDPTKLIQKTGPFQDIDIKNIDRPSIMIMEGLTLPSLKLSAIFYHEPTKQIVDLSRFLFDKNDNFNPKISDDVEPEFHQEYLKYLNSIGITDNQEGSIRLLLRLRNNLKMLEHNAIMSSVTNEELNLQHEAFSQSLNETIKKNIPGTWIHFSSIYIITMMKEELVRRGDVKICMKYNHASEACLFNPKDKHDMRRGDETYKTTIEKTPILQIEPNNDPKVMAKEKTIAKQIIGNNNLTVLHALDIENTLRQTIKEQDGNF